MQQLADHTAPLSKLAARHGAYFVTGNHEYYSGERDWTRELRDSASRCSRMSTWYCNTTGPRSCSRESTTSGRITSTRPNAATRPRHCVERRRNRRPGSARPPAHLRCRRGEGRFRRAAVRPYARRTVLALEPFRAFLSAVHGGLASTEGSLGLRSRGTGYWGRRIESACHRRSRAFGSSPRARSHLTTPPPPPDSLPSVTDSAGEKRRWLSAWARRRSQPPRRQSQSIALG